MRKFDSDGFRGRGVRGEGAISAFEFCNPTSGPSPASKRRQWGEARLAQVGLTATGLWDRLALRFVP